MSANNIHPMIDENCSTSEQIQFRKQFEQKEFFIQNHIIQNRRVLPGVAYLEMALASAAIVSKKNIHQIRNIDFLEMLAESSGLTKPIFLNLISENGNLSSFSIDGGESGKSYCRGQINNKKKKNSADHLPISEIKKRCTSRLTRDDYYEILNQAGFQYGEGFKATTTAQFNRSEIIVRAELPTELDHTLADYILHPVMVDSAVQAAILLTLLLTNNKEHKLFVPLSIASCDVYDHTKGVMYLHSQLKSELNHDKKFAKYDLTLSDEDGNICVEIKGMFLKIVEGDAAGREDSNVDALYDLPAMRKAVESIAHEFSEKEEHHSSAPIENGDSTNASAAVPAVGGEDSAKGYAISFLTSLLSKSLNVPADDIDINQNVGMYGLNSLLIFELNNVLEQKFPDISRVLFFEYPTVSGLSDYLVENYKEILVQSAGGAHGHGASEESDVQHESAALTKASNNGSRSEEQSVAALNTDTGRINKDGETVFDSGLSTPVLIHEKELQANADLQETIDAIDTITPPILYLRLIYPYLFISAKRNQYVRLFVQESKKVMVPCFPVHEEVGRELKEYCEKHGYRLLIVDEYHEWLDTEEFKLVPLGVWQDVDLNNFTLAGNKMRKFRYMVNKFQKIGDVKLEEYREDSALPLEEMRTLMINWSKGKQFIIRSTLTCMEELLQRKIQNGYRAFLTYENGKLCSVIVIEKNKEGSYVMDQEFYDPETAPLGHLEFSIAEIIEILKSEKQSIFSLGLTWYPMIFADHPKTDSEGWTWISEQYEQGTPLGKIFEQAQPNYQFKKKIGVAGDPFYAYIPKDEQVSFLLEYWPVFSINALPASKIESSLSNLEIITQPPKTVKEDVALTTEQSRRDYLNSGHKLIDIGFHDVPIDLLTDTWHHVKSPFVQKRIEQLDAEVTMPTVEVFKEIFPFKHFILTDQGRTAEELFYRVFPKDRKKIYTAIPWSTTLMHQLNNKFEVFELPKKTALNFQADDLYKGEIDVEQLKTKLSEEEGRIALVGIEALNNGCGGVPIRLSHLAEVKNILQKHTIPLVLDASRIVRNTLLQSLENKSVWEMISQFMGHADHIVMSLTKDFATPIGGLIATNDDALAAALREEQKRRGFELAAHDELRILRAVSDHDLIEKLNREQLAFTQSVGTMLTELGVPILKPAYGHAVLVDVSSLVTGESIYEKKERFLEELFVKAGIRGSIHQVGKQKNTLLDKCIRLAFPLGQSGEEQQAVQAALHTYFSKFSSNQKSSDIGKVDSFEKSAQVTSKRIHEGPESRDIAIIGLSGRYPQARNITEFWENLKGGKNCISEIPLDRWNWQNYFHPDRIQAGSMGKSYAKWGGFMADVDKFDPLFFNIPPSEAENMDPQERLFLQVAWEVLEDAGYAEKGLNANTDRDQGNKVGVFVGATWQEYQLYSQSAGSNGTALLNNICNIANRVSYFFGFNGSSLTVDTACSSSLTAIDLACASLIQGTNKMAIAGGVNLSLHPCKYQALAKYQFLSTKGFCESFGNDGDGYVPAEGVGAVLLKPLSRAIADDDHIYGIIKATATNHGGKANGYTVPNPNSQASLVRSAVELAGINPRAISYIEAHGTGTSLGDPIEISGLTQAFRKYTQDNQFCAIGSAKSNIGHCEAAAGIAGLTKVLLQLKHRQLAPSLHSTTLNENINFRKTPFVVQQELAEWKRPVIDENGEKREYPRIAGVSAFGAWGSNAHVLIEEYIPKDHDRPHITITTQNPAIIVLSARDEERLKEQAKQFLSAIEKQQFSGIDLSDMAYTLQVGRVAMEERLAVIASSLKDLEEKLKGFVEGKEGIDDLFLGQTKRDKETVSAFTFDEELQEAVNKWIQRKKYAQLMKLWVKGLKVDWNKLYGDTKPRRISSLPTYPFARERYWLPEASKGQDSGDRVPVIHPLLHQNTSDLSEQRYSSTFTGQEFFLADHVVKGMHVLPGVAFLEMARAAVEQAAGVLAEDETGIRLKDIAWVRPIVVGDQPIQVHISLFPEDNGEISYEIYSRPEGNGAESVLHNQGVAALGSVAQVSALDLPGIQAQCTQGSLISSRCYDAFKAMGLQYGPAYQGIEQVYVGQGEVLAKLCFPPSVSHTKDQFFLHPSLMDSALQTSIALIMNLDDTSGKAPRNPVLPFALGEIEVLGRCSTSTMWSYVRYSDGSKAGDKVQKLDIDICDESGNVCQRIKEFSLRVLEGDIKTSPVQVPGMVLSDSSSEALVGNLMLKPVWDTFPVEKIQPFPSRTDHIVIVGGDDGKRSIIQQKYPKTSVLEIGSTDTIDVIGEKLEALDFIDHVFWMAPSHYIESLAEDAIIEEQNQGVLQVFRMIKALLGLGYGKKDLGVSVITVQAQAIHENDVVNPTHAGLYGLMGSLAKEYPNWRVRIIDLETESDLPISEIFSLPTDARGNALAYRGGEWYQQKLIPERSHKVDHTLHKTAGVYVVIGGAGGIGEAWSEYMIRTYQARIIWIGRRQKNAAIQAKLDRLATIGQAPIYIAADATDRHSLQRAYEEIKAQYAQINGVIHAAILLLDKGLANMDEDRFKTALSAKVDVSVRIAQVFQKEPLDFVLFFSSLNSFLKAAGQSNYAAGCTFKDSFAHALSQQWPCAVKVMNWGYWGSVGIVASKAYQDRMAQLGFGSIEPPEAMEALETLLSGPTDQIVMIKTTKPLSLEGMIPEELITVCPQSLPSILKILHNHIPESDPRIQRMKTEIVPPRQNMDELLCKLLWGQLQSIGLFGEKSFVIAELKAGLRDLYDRWLKETIAVLSRNNYLHCDGTSCTAIDTSLIDRDAVWKQWDLEKGAWLEDPNMKALVVLVEKMVRALPEILTGRAVATDIMFPNSSMALVEGIYKNNNISDYFNEALAGTVVAYIKERIQQDTSARIRVLEIGAGTGGTSAMVFEKLKPYQDHIQEYCYTDISKAFLMHAEKEYGAQNPYLTYNIFNVEAPIAGQEISAGVYDIAIATNVLHATRNMRQTIRNAKAVLQKNGLLLINEISSNPLAYHLTFGLLEGWWLYEDRALRIPGCPGLSPGTWEMILEREGFKSVLFPAQEAHELGQQIIVAESDGVIRQKQEYKSIKASGKKTTSVKTSDLKISEDISHKQKKSPITQPGEIALDLIREKSTAYIKELVGETLKIPTRKIDSSAPLEEYGIDSILVIQLTNDLSKVLKNVSSTLFFEHQTIDELVEHFIKTEKDSLIALLGLENQNAQQIMPGRDEISAEVPPNRSRGSLKKSRRFLSVSPEIEEQKSQPAPIQDIAIIGLAGRYPQANNMQEFWQIFRDGKDCVTEIPQKRWDYRKHYDSDKGKSGKSYCKWGGFIDDVDKFDPSFFNISSDEAIHMDPQERLFMETVSQAVEDAGYTRDSLEKEKVGVYVGAMYTEYQLLGLEEALKGNVVPVVSVHGVMANRVSYHFGFTGPSIAVDTLCSSSITAIHMACESIRSGECGLAIAGGVNVLIHWNKYHILSKLGLVSDDGKHRSFGEGGEGFVPAEGVGAVLLKPLAAAIRDRDNIYAVIKGSSINSAGKRNGFMVPNPKAQTKVVLETLQKSQIDPRTIGYIESFALGTSLGDPIEVSGLTKAFSEYTDNKQYCSIGAGKTNTGHMESASGISAVTKVILQMKNKQLAPSLHSEILNPKIDFPETPFYVQHQLQEWKQPVIRENGEEKKYPRRAGVTSYGAGGSYGFLLLEEYENPPANEPTAQNETPRLIVLSAKNKERLRDSVKGLMSFLERKKGNEINLTDIAYTLHVGREAMEECLAVIVSSVQELIEKLSLFNQGTADIENCYSGNREAGREKLGMLLEGRAGEEFLGTILRSGELAKIAQIWVSGAVIDWELFYADQSAKRISMPTYPFARERYWVSSATEETRHKNLKVIKELGVA
jgi:acyl transferase domain-containing protein/tryptophanase/SAM-dependent methyltransferase